MLIHVVQKPPVADLDGVDLGYFQVGIDYDVGTSIASVFLAEGWAEPVPFDRPQTDVAFDVPATDPNNPPNLVKEDHLPFLDHDKAIDFRWRRRPRR